MHSIRKYRFLSYTRSNTVDNSEELLAVRKTQRSIDPVAESSKPSFSAG